MIHLIDQRLRFGGINIGMKWRSRRWFGGLPNAPRPIDQIETGATKHVGDFGSVENLAELANGTVGQQLQLQFPLAMDQLHGSRQSKAKMFAFEPGVQLRRIELQLGEQLIKR